MKNEKTKQKTRGGRKKPEVHETALIFVSFVSSFLSHVFHICSFMFLIVIFSQDFLFHFLLVLHSSSFLKFGLVWFVLFFFFFLFFFCFCFVLFCFALFCFVLFFFVLFLLVFFVFDF